MSLLSFEDVQRLRFPEAGTPQLVIQSWSNSARTILIRGFCRDNVISINHVTKADRSEEKQTVDIPDFPVILQVFPSAETIRRGECFVKISLSMAGPPVGILVAGYVTNNRTLSWPPGVLECSISGPGLIRLVTGTNPAAGAEISESVPTNARWRLRSLYVALTTAVAVANRTVYLLIDNGVSTFWYKAAGAVQAASLTRYYLFTPAYPIDEAAFDVYNILRTPLLHDLVLFQGWRISTVTNNLQAADDYAAPLLYVEEWIEE